MKFTIASILLASSYAADKNVKNLNGVSVDFIGTSGAIRVTPTDSEKGWTKLSWEKIEEIDSSGKVVNSVNNMASTDFTWSDPTTGKAKDGTTDVTLLGFETTFKNGGKMTVKAYLPAAAATVEVPSCVEGTTGCTSPTKTDVAIPAGGIEFALYMESWPFANTDNKLRFGADVQTKAGTIDGEEGSSAKESVKSESKTCDGKAVATSWEIGNKKAKIIWTFPNFKDAKLCYDPFIGSGSSALAPSLGMAALLVAASQWL